MLSYVSRDTSYRYQAEVWSISRNITSLNTLVHDVINLQGCHSFHALKIEKIWERITNIFEICQNLALNLRRIEEISHMHVLLDTEEVLFSSLLLETKSNFSPNWTTLNKKKWDIDTICRNYFFARLLIEAAIQRCS